MTVFISYLLNQYVESSGNKGLTALKKLKNDFDSAEEEDLNTTFSL